MPHPLLNRGKTTHGNNPKENAQAQQALASNQYVGEIFVGRRKVWEGRASTEQEAYKKASQQKAQYAGANPEIKVKRVKQGT